MRRSSRQFEGPAPGRRTRRAAVAGCLSAVALGAAAAPAMAVDPTTFSDDPNAGVTLREAISATPAGQAIQLQAGEYKLSKADGGPEDGNANGDLDITKPLTIAGAGIDQTIIRNANAPRVDGVLHVIETLNLSGVTITGGVRNNPPSNEQRGYGAGGGIRVGVTGGAPGFLVAERVKVSGNQAFQGAGVFVSGTATRSTATFADSVISGNLAQQYGGGISAFGDVTLDRASVLRNKSNAFGGGLILWANPRANLTATNTTIGGNQAIQNGGGLLTGGIVNLDFVTLANNAAQSGRNLLFDGGKVTFSNSIVAGSADNSCANAVPGDIVSGGFNIDQGATCIAPTEGSGDRINVPPTGDGGINLVEPQPLQGINYYRLASNSVAIDTGTDFCFQPVDQRGVFRPQGLRCDVGAIEQEPPALGDVGVESFVEDPDPAVAGSEVTYEAVIRNVGTGTVNDVVAKMSVPDTTTYVSASNGCSRPRRDALRCELGALSPDQAATVLLTVKTTVPGTIRNRADVSARAGEDVNRGNNRLPTTAEVEPRIDPDPKVTVGLVKGIKRTAKKIAFTVGVNRDNATARVALLSKRFGTLVVKNVKFAQAGNKTVTLKLSKAVRRKLARLKANTKLTLRVEAELSNGEDLIKTMRVKINRKRRIVRA